MIIENPTTPLTEIFDPLFEQRQIRFFIKREELTDEFISRVDKVLEIKEKDIMTV